MKGLFVIFCQFIRKCFRLPVAGRFLKSVWVINYFMAGCICGNKTELKISALFFCFSKNVLPVLMAIVENRNVQPLPAWWLCGRVLLWKNWLTIILHSKKTNLLSLSMQTGKWVLRLLTCSHFFQHVFKFILKHVQIVIVVHFQSFVYEDFFNSCTVINMWSCPDRLVI